MDRQLLLAAEKGNAEAQFNLGVMYENGLDDTHYAVEGSRLEAMRWLLAAAEQGLPRAQIKLAEMYAGEPDTPGSSVKACGWFLLATTSLRGAHLQKAQSGYERASLHLRPAQIAKARHFARSWRRTAPVIAPMSDQREIATQPGSTANSNPDRLAPGGTHRG
jgi:TPR repeat protein